MSIGFVQIFQLLVNLFFLKELLVNLGWWKGLLIYYYTCKTWNHQLIQNLFDLKAVQLVMSTPALGIGRKCHGLGYMSLGAPNFFFMMGVVYRDTGFQEGLYSKVH